jgi:antitoxin component YwqK of YwqJK toxin-antitoxin module
MVGMTLVSAGAVADTCTLNGKPVQLDDGATTAGKTGIVICQRDGKLWRKFEYKNGKKMGYTYFAQSDGSTEEFSTNEKGNKNGPQKNHAKNGKLILSCQYDNGDYVGLFQSFYENGKPKIHAWYEKGETSPLMEIEYNKDGALTSVSCGKKAFSDIDRDICGFNSPHAVTLVETDGKTEKRIYHGGRLSESTESSKAGKVLVRSEYKDGLQYRKSFFENGSPESETTLKDSRKLSEISFYMNGNRKSEVTYKHGPDKTTLEIQEYSNAGKLLHKGGGIDLGDDQNRPIGPQEDYFESGVLKATDNYNDVGERDGEQKAYNEKGVLRELKVYQKDVLKHGRFYDDSGKLKSDREYYPDGSYKELAGAGA